MLNFKKKGIFTRQVPKEDASPEQEPQEGGLAGATGADDNAELPWRSVYIQLRFKGEICAGLDVEQRFHAGCTVAVEVRAAVLNAELHTHTTFSLRPCFVSLA